MAQLIVRNLDPALVRKLKLRAAHKGHSAEAEHREILHRALGDDPPGRSFKEHLLAMPDIGSDADLAPRRGRRRPVRL